MLSNHIYDPKVGLYGDKLDAPEGKFHLFLEIPSIPSSVSRFWLRPPF
jgi:hypothetical protein